MDTFLFKAPQQSGIDTDLQYIEQLIKTQRFVDVQTYYRKLPVGEWPQGLSVKILETEYLLDEKLKEVGKLAVSIFTRALPASEALGRKLFPHLTDEERKTFNEEVLRDIENPKHKLYSDTSFQHISI